jgi:hypothetical protein
MAGKEAPPPAKRVAVLAPDGSFGTVDAADVENLPDGSRVLTQKEVAAQQLQEAYDKKSGLEKVGQALLGHGIGPQSEAFLTAGRRAFSAGTNEALVKTAADAVAPGAGKAYADNLEKLATGAPEATTAGTIAGIAGTVATSFAGGGNAGAGLSRLLPANAVGAAGGVAEGLAARGLAAAGVNATSALGKAGVAAATLGVRGAAEGALYSAIEETSRQVTHDPEISADKVFSVMGTGALFGGGVGAAGGAAGSLVSSALERAAIARTMRNAEAAAVGTGGGTAAEVVGRGGYLKSAANDLAADALGATKVQMRNAIENVAGGKAAIGEYVNRIAIRPAVGESGALAGTVKAGMSGRPAELLEAIQADKAGRLASGFDEALRGTPARFDMTQLSRDAAEIHAEMLKDPTRVAGAESFFRRVETELGAIQASGRVAADGTMEAAEAFKLRSQMERAAWEMSQSSGSAGDAYKGLMRKWDASILETIDEAGKAAGKTDVGDKIRYLKREWQLATAAEEMAKGGAERIAGNNIFGLREGIGMAAGIAMGNPIGGLAAGIGGKILRERGAAMGAHLLNTLSESQAVAKLIGSVDEKLNAAAHGLLAPPSKQLSTAKLGNPHDRAAAALRSLSQMQADPHGTVEKMTKNVEAIAESHPEIADALVSKQAAALAFLASKKPADEEPDPLSPHKAPRMTDADAYRFAKYAYYTEQPDRFFDEVAKGKVTYEGAETARALMPKAFAELQARMLDAIATHMARGRAIPFQQRERLGDILDIPATPSQRPDHASFLQSNVVNSTSQPSPRPSAAKSSASPGKAQRSALDMLEANGPGRR